MFSLFANEMHSYILSNGIAYTEDHVQIQKLYINRIPLGLSEMDIDNYFSSFGRVKRAHLFAQRKMPQKKKGEYRAFGTQAGYVYFADPHAAAKALIHKRHTFNGRKFIVQPSDSWHQPNAYGGLPRHPPVSLPNQDRPPTPTTPQPEIFMLNDYCFEHILIHLPIVDQVHFGRTCNRFRSVYQMATGRLHKCVDFDEFANMTVWDIKDFFQLSGCHVQKMEGIIPIKHRARLLEFLGNHCHNLKVLEVSTSDLKPQHTYKLFAKLKNLEEVQLVASALSNASINALRNLENLKTLDLSHNSDITGMHFNHLPKSITELKLKNCISLQSTLWSKIFKSLPDLTHLDVSQIPGMRTRIVRKMASECQKLEKLVMSADSDAEYEIIATMPKLKEFSFYPNTTDFRVRHQLFKELVRHKADQLEVLKIFGCNMIRNDMASDIAKLCALRTLYIPNNSSLRENELEEFSKLINLEYINLRDCINVKNYSIVRLINTCRKLNKVNLECCSLIDNNLIYDVIRNIRLQMKNKENIRTLPITLYVSETQINEYMLNDPEYVSASDIVKISFNCDGPNNIMDQLINDLYLMDDPDFFAYDTDEDDDSDFSDPRFMFDAAFLSDDDDDDSINDEYIIDLLYPAH